MDDVDILHEARRLQNMLAKQVQTVQEPPRGPVSEEDIQRALGEGVEAGLRRSIEAMYLARARGK